MSDLLERYLSEERRAEPPPPRAGLRDSILNAYDHSIRIRTAKPPRRNSAPKYGFLAIAAMLLGGLFMFLRPNGAAQPSSAAVVVAKNTPFDVEFSKLQIEARVRAAKATVIAMGERRIVTAAPPPVIIQKNPRTIRDVAALTKQPVEPVLRLVAARLFEDIDKSTAIDRYRELLKDYPQSPACGVANNRLRALTP